jgi:hypothetical protein
VKAAGDRRASSRATSPPRSGPARPARHRVPRVMMEKHDDAPCASSRRGERDPRNLNATSSRASTTTSSRPRLGHRGYEALLRNKIYRSLGAHTARLHLACLSARSPP